MDRRKDEGTDRQMNGQRDGGTEGWTEQIGRRTNRQADGQRDRQRDGQHCPTPTPGCTGGNPPHRRTEGRTHRQTPPPPPWESTDEPPHPPPWTDGHVGGWMDRWTHGRDGWTDSPPPTSPHCIPSWGGEGGGMGTRPPPHRGADRQTDTEDGQTEGWMVVVWGGYIRSSGSGGDRCTPPHTPHGSTHWAPARSSARCTAVHRWSSSLWGEGVSGVGGSTP